MKKTRRRPTLHDQKYRDLVLVLIAARKRTGLTQLELAERLGVSQPDISKIERFERRIDALELIEWLQVLGCGKHSKVYEIWEEIYENYRKP